MEIARHKSALVRGDLSRPLRLAMGDGLVHQQRSVMDYGCGRGGDVARLRDAGFDCSGWDPVHAPDGQRRRSSVVNLGYVINVVEDEAERRDVIRRAWALAEDVLVVSARLVNERPSASMPTLGDGIVTRLGTFQKFFEQQELRQWIDQALDETSVAAAPGIFYVFRDPASRSAFVASRYRRAPAVPRLKASEMLYAQHRELLDRLAAFIAERGRPPAEEEWPETEQLARHLGSVGRAVRVLQQASEAGDWASIRATRSQDLLVYIALSRFDGRPKLSELGLSMQLDVKAFFGSYQKACASADTLLYSLGQQSALDAALTEEGIGKRLPMARYVHVSAIDALPILLRLYEGCARSYAGTIEGANIVKLARGEPKISYLAYPDFDNAPHPVLTASTSIRLQTFKIRERSYAQQANPPLLHRKEAFLAPDHPLREKFARLTRAEEAHGLLDDAATIGTRDGWEARLCEQGLALKGHRLIRRTS